MQLDSNKRGDKKSPPKKFDYKKYKKNTLKSLNDVEYFLNNYKKFKYYFKIYKLFK